MQHARFSRPTNPSSLAPAAALLLLALAPLTFAQPPVTWVDASSTLPPFNHSGVSAGGDGLGGAAWFDCNNDRRLDLFLTNGRGQDNALFLNTPTGFVDISAAAGIRNNQQGNSGVIAADIDNDGLQDLFLTGDGGFVGVGDSPVALFRNLGDCRFADITATSNITGPISHMSAAFGDIDNDRDLDLFVTASGSFCLTPSPTCVPGNHPNKLYRNDGGGVFTDISLGSGVDTANGACATYFGHYDNDPWIDLFVGNCNLLTPPPVPVLPVPAANELFRNLGGASFTDVGPAAGLTPTGFFMGFAPADFDNDLDIDFFMTNMGTSVPAFPNSFFWKNGTLCPAPPPTYLEVSSLVIQPDQEFGWGTTAQDFDNNGFVDIFSAGALPPGIIGPGPTGGNPGTLLFNQLPLSAVFADFTSSLPASIDLANKYSSGVAAADYDNDGDVDLVIQTDDSVGTGGKPVLLQNQGHPTNHWLRVRLRGTVSNPAGIGARIVVGYGQRSQMREVHAGSSFLSMDSQWQHFGLGAESATSLLAVWWPSHRVEIFPNVAADQTITLVEGNGALVDLNCPDG